MQEQKFVDFMETAVGVRKVAFPSITDRDIAFTLYTGMVSAGVADASPFENCLEVKDSPIHGQGVFAKTDINKDLVVCIYPCDGVIEKNKLFSTSLKSLPTHFNPHSYKFALRSRHSGGAEWAAGKQGGKSVSKRVNEVIDDQICIYGDPSIRNDYCLGHLINDSYKDVAELKNKDIGKMVLKYMIKAGHYKNCAFVVTRYYIYVKTTTAIAKGEELMAPYGFPYWFDLPCPEIMKLYRNYVASLSLPQIKRCYMIAGQYYSDHTPLPPSKRVTTVIAMFKRQTASAAKRRRRLLQAPPPLPKSTAVDGSEGKGQRHHQRWPDNFRDGDQILRNLEAVYEAGLVPKKAYERKKLQLLALKI